ATRIRILLFATSTDAIVIANSLIGAELSQKARSSQQASSIVGPDEGRASAIQHPCLHRFPPYRVPIEPDLPPF
ncbi:MAG: hypothetical protein ACRYG8_41555, partial [Janthinobacterium lividum]